MRMSSRNWSQFSSLRRLDHAGHVDVRPGLREVAVVLAFFAVSFYVVLPQLLRLVPSDDATVTTLLSTALLLVLMAMAFAAAKSIRRLPLSSFGVRKVSVKWLVVAVIFGIIYSPVAGLLALGFVAITGGTNEAAGRVTSAGGGSLVALAVSFIFIAMLTPLAEEFIFRGIVTNGLARFGPWVAVLGSAIPFALIHGAPQIASTFILGVANALLMRHTKSVWPAVLLHGAYNATAVIAGAAIAG